MILEVTTEQRRNVWNKCSDLENPPVLTEKNQV